MLTPARIAVLVSGGGTNLQALLDAQRDGKMPHGEIVLVVSSRAGAYALTRAENAGVAARVLTPSCGQELFENKLLGWAFRQVHGFPVDRGNMDMGAIRTAMGVLKEGETLGIFPEGTRSRTGHMLPLLGGASLLALKSGCDVVPIYIEGSYKPFHRMIVHVGRPVEMTDLRAGRMNRETCDELTRRMEAEFAQLSGGKSLPPAEA